MTNHAQGPIVAMTGINWIFLYRVEYEDEAIVILKDLGRFHRWDEARSWNGEPITAYIDIINEYVRAPGKPLRLVEVH